MPVSPSENEPRSGYPGYPGRAIPPVGLSPAVGLSPIELKLGDFKPADSGQMELYLRWLDRHERQPSEQAPLGVILCAGKKRETVEYLDLDTRGIHVAEYLTELPPRAVLEDRLHRAIKAARERLAIAADQTEVPRAMALASVRAPKRRSTKLRARR